MEIIKKSQLEYVGYPYFGRCRVCGCEFKTTIEVAETLTGKKRYRATEHIPHFKLQEDRDRNVFFVCDCPECGFYPAELHETE